MSKTKRFIELKIELKIFITRGSLQWQISQINDEKADLLTIKF